MEVEALQEFARRRRDLVDRLKADFWVGEKRRLTAAQALSVAEGLRRSVLVVKSGWPSEDDRAKDLECHQELARKLALARPPSGR